jgi:hypothetical protein
MKTGKKKYKDTGRKETEKERCGKEKEEYCGV